MKIVSQWEGTPTFDQAYPDLWEKIKRAILQDPFGVTCYVSNEDYSNQVVLNIVDTDDERIGTIRYTRKQVRKSSPLDISTDLSTIVGVHTAKHRQLLRHVFSRFLVHDQWPNSREMSVMLKRLGNYYNLAADIEPEYIRAGEERVAGATSRLTVRGIALVEGSKDELLLFLRVLKVFVQRYSENPREPTVAMLDLNKSDTLSVRQVDRISLMIQEERHLWTGAASLHEKKFTFTVAPSILEFEKVETIRDYLRVQASLGRSDESVALPFEAVETPSGDIGGPPETMVSQFEYDLFISYSSRDQEKANKINEEAKKVGLKPFLAPKNIKGGEIGIEKIKDAIRNSAEVVVLVSKNSLASGWVFAEWGAAWILNKHITPLLYRCDADDIPDLLKQPQHMDLDELDGYLEQVLERKNEP